MLMAGLLDTQGPSAGPTALSNWAREHASVLDRRYASEMRRRRERSSPYFLHAEQPVQVCPATLAERPATQRSLPG